MSAWITIRNAVMDFKKVLSKMRGPSVLLIAILMASAASLHAANNNITAFTLSGPNVSSVTCPSGAYLVCYKVTMSSIDAFGLTTGSGFRTIVNPNSTNPTSTQWISDDTFTFQVGNSLNNQTATISIFQVTAGFTHTYLTPQYCLSGCTSTGAYSTIPAASTAIYSTVSEGPGGGPANTYSLSLATLMNAGNGASFATFGTPGVQGDTYQFDIHVVSTQGNKQSDILITFDVQRAATAMMTTITYPQQYGPMQGLRLSAATPSTSSPFNGTITYGNYTFVAHFSQFSSTTGSLVAYVSSNFSPALAAASVAMCDASANTTAAVCTPLSTTAGSPTTITTTMTDNVTFSHYLGVVVAEGTGFPGTSTSGSTNATAQFTFQVP